MLHLPLGLGEVVADRVGAVQYSSRQFQVSRRLTAHHQPWQHSWLLKGRRWNAPRRRMVSSSVPKNAILDSAPCSVGFQILIEQPNIRGIGGPFIVLLEENGTTSLAKPV
jgi:hypothetical protein